MYKKLIETEVASDTRKLDTTEAFTIGIYGPAGRCAAAINHAQGIRGSAAPRAAGASGDRQSAVALIEISRPSNREQSGFFGVSVPVPLFDNGTDRLQSGRPSALAPSKGSPRSVDVAPSIPYAGFLISSTWTRSSI